MISTKDLQRMIATCLGYAALAYLSLPTFVENGYARVPIVWPASGFALAAVCAWGAWMMPAIAAGTLILWLRVHAVAFPGALLIGVAAAIQACIGSVCYRKLEGGPERSSSVRRASSLVIASASFGSILVPWLVVKELSPPSVGLVEAAHFFVARWSAEAMGCLIVAPLMLLWIGKTKRAWSNRMATSLLLGALLLGTSSVLHYAFRGQAQAIEGDFTERSIAIVNLLKRQLLIYGESLKSIGQFYDTHGIVTRAEFERLAKPFLQRHKGIQAIEWIPLVRAADRARHEARGRAEGIPDYRITEMRAPGVMVPRGLAAEYFPVFYIVPMDLSNRPALGYDVVMTPDAARNLALARSSGALSYSDPIRLVQEWNGQTGVVAYQPIHSAPAPGSEPGLSEDHFLGVVAGVFRMGNVVEAALSGVDLSSIDLTLEDSSRGGPEGVLYELKNPDQGSTSYAYSVSLPLENQVWRFTTHLTIDGLSRARRFAAWLLPAGAVLTTVVTVLLLLILTGRSAEIEALIIRRTEELRRSMRARDDFLSVASHELKTPLTPLRLQVDFLKSLSDRGELVEFAGTPEYGRLMENLGLEIDRYARLVDDLLDISRLSSGKIRLRRSPSDLAELVRSVIEGYDRELKRAGCEVKVEARGAPRGDWDTQRLKQVVVNLLSNAVKYGRGSPIHVLVDGDEQRSLLEVADQGIGISEEDQARIFGRFERAVSTRNYAGLGVGLFIAREIVLAHGGSISVSSRIGKGAKFRVELPASAVDQARMPSGENAPV